MFPPLLTYCCTFLASLIALMKSSAENKAELNKPQVPSLDIHYILCNCRSKMLFSTNHDYETNFSDEVATP